jgi:ferritin-like metal-binding protein YciE
MDRKQVEELLYQALETELGGVQVYKTAIRCAENEELKEEWEKYGEQTKRHVQIVEGIFERFGLDKKKETPGRQIVREKGKTLVAAMEKALREAPDGAQIVAAECIVDAETKDHMNWELMGEIAKKLTGDEKKALEEAQEEVEDEEDEHLYHTMGWTRELWLDSLGLPAVLPPPEEEKDVKTAIGAARAKQDRKEMLKKKKPSQPRASA